MSEPIDTAALRKLLADAEGFHPLQGSPASLLMVALMALLDEVERLREHHEKSIEVGLHLADDSNHWVKVADKLEARIDAALRLAPECERFVLNECQELNVCPCKPCALRAALVGDK